MFVPGVIRRSGPGMAGARRSLKAAVLILMYIAETNKYGIISQPNQ